MADPQGTPAARSPTRQPTVSDDVVIRLARRDEFDEVGRLTAQTYLGEGFIGPDNPYVEVLRDAAGRATGAELWVAEERGEVIGTVTFCPPGSVYRQSATESEGEFRALAVAPNARGRGVGRQLVELCFARCRAFGLGQLVLLSQDAMRSAHRLYTDLGFGRDTTLDWSPQSGVRLHGFRADVPAGAESR
jgi:GNAT superfamily N-acetyltransferase